MAVLLTTFLLSHSISLALSVPHYVSLLSISLLSLALSLSLSLSLSLFISLSLVASSLSPYLVY